MMSMVEKIMDEFVSEEGREILALDCGNIGPSVSSGKISDIALQDITAICRRRFKRNDVLVWVDLDEDGEYEEGVVFTDTALFYWKDSGSNVVRINYKDIESVDFDDEGVFIRHENMTTDISLGDDAEVEKYPRYMYNFIMDILDIQGVETGADTVASKEEHIPSFLKSAHKKEEDWSTCAGAGKASASKMLNMIMGELEEGKSAGISVEDMAVNILKQLEEMRE